MVGAVNSHLMMYVQLYICLNFVLIRNCLHLTGRDFGLSTVAVVGGMDITKQALQLLKNPHIIIATLGRLVDHLKRLKGFSLSSIQYLVSSFSYLLHSCLC